MKTPDVVLLLPGFFGFDHFGTYYYFADRVSSAIRGHLGAKLGRSVPVIPLATGPADSLAHRQREFFASIAVIDEQFGGIERIHLCGHSTGGLDAEFLLHRTRLDGRPWTECERVIRARIASVTTIAAPHYGTTLAMTKISRFLGCVDVLQMLRPSYDYDEERLRKHPWSDLRFCYSALPVLMAVARTVPERTGTGIQLLGSLGAIRSFLMRLLQQSELSADLVPENVERLRAQNPLEIDGVRRTCFVTCSVANPTPSKSRMDKPDALFSCLEGLTRKTRVPAPSPEILDNIRRLNAPDMQRIMSSSENARQDHVFDESDNDAIVNTTRQLLPDADLGAIVYADHADVLGHYDRRDPLRHGEYLLEGVFRSGAQFGDDEFFELYHRVADIVASVASTAGPRRRTRAVQPGAATGA